MPGLGALSFTTIRTWNGEQSRAFEEISYQLLKERVPAGTHAIRTGNPDGGVEWYATLPDGTEWGWQAKYVDGIEALLTAMTDSVKRVAQERPQLRKLTFVISWNLATGTRAGKIKSQRQKYNDKVKAWQDTIPNADRIEFDLVQESELLDELAKPEHRGRRWFWWDELVLGVDWLEQRYQEQAAAAGQKYRPDLQVDVPIQDDLLALGFDQSMLMTFDRLRRDVISAVADLYVSSQGASEPAASIYEAVAATAGALKTTASALTLQAGDAPNSFQPLHAHMNACVDAIVAAEEYEHQLAAERRKLPDGDPAKSARTQGESNKYGVRVLRTAIGELESWLESSTGCSFQSRTYFLTGQAGSGKTHLLLDAVRRALDAGRPAVFLAGGQFGQSDLWASIADQLGLQSVGADVLLRALDAAGEAASTSGSRFVIFIDALNETTQPDFWRIRLPRLRATMALYPHIALAVSCRDTYRDLVLEEGEGAHYVKRAHPGFAEREVEATHRYFEHYGLEAPRIPLLTPEFTLPLFLRLYCESLSQAEGEPIPTGHEGRVAVFERYLAAKVSIVARRFLPSATSSYELNRMKVQVERVLDSLLDEMATHERESMSADAAEAVAKTALDGSTADATKLLGLLQEEGVLTRERLYLEKGKIGDGVRIVFQAFSDFLLLKRRLALSSDPVNDPTLTAWLTDDCSWGILEAANVLFPEVYGVELPDVLGATPIDDPGQDSEQADWQSYHRTRQLYRSLVETLPYRDSQAISLRTIDLLNDAQVYFQRSEFYRVLFTLAPQPGNRLNGDGLHRYLLQVPMAERDSDFGFATYHELTEASSPATRLARWAASGPYPAYDAEVIELACIPLCWLLSSPNRFMRDWVTKALVQLLHGHLDVMRALLKRFWTVDDPYVVQRVVVIAYGSVLRSRPSQADQAKGLAVLVHDLVFMPPVRPDELLLDAARGVVRWAVGHGLLPTSALESSRRPYGLKVPGAPPSKETFEAKYPWNAGEPEDESYSSIRFSLFGMGDFARYVVEPGVRHFSRYRIGQDPPERRQRRPRFVKTRWQQFAASLSVEQSEVVAAWLNSPGGRGTATLRFRLSEIGHALTEDQQGLLNSVFVYPKLVSNTYSADVACRWIFRRTISLGWTPKLFGREDRFIGHGSGRESHKAERWGKKYQWMAYHELLARIADNYQSALPFHDSKPYEGLHQITGDREIDPSLPPIDYRAFAENGGQGTNTWAPSLIHLSEWPSMPLNFSRYQGDVQRFLADAESEPTVAGSMLVNDRAGEGWVVLDSSVTKVDPLADKGWRGLQERSALSTLLVTAGDAKSLLAAIAQERRDDLHHLADSNDHTDCCYVGEVGRVGPACPYRHDSMQPATIGDRSFQVAPTTEKYTWEGSILDCSIGETVSAILPSSLIQQAAGLTFDMRGPCWLDAAGVPVFTYYEEPGNKSHALLVRASFLRAFLSAQKLELIVFHWFERMSLGGDYDDEHPYVEVSTNARLTSDLKVYTADPKRRTRDLSEAE